MPPYDTFSISETHESSQILHFAREYFAATMTEQATEPCDPSFNPLVGRRDLDKLAGTGDKICEDADTQIDNAFQNPINVQMGQIQQLQ